MPTLLLIAACGSDPEDVDIGGEATPAFVALGKQVGLDFTHRNGMFGGRNFVEIMGPGCAFFDYDRDGDLDVYVVQGHSLSPESLKNVPLGNDRGSPEVTDRLYRNDLSSDGAGSLELHFTDVTQASGIFSPGYGMGVATGDIDNDGWIDLYVTNWGPNQLWRNNGDGTWSDWTERSATGDPGWGTSCVFVDIDGDGLQDLFIANYVTYTETTHRDCFAPSSAPDYCGPTNFPPQSDRLYHNLGDGRFEDISHSSGISQKQANGLGVAVADFNGDGALDIYVANDGDENFLWFNRGDRTFFEGALVSGCSLNVNGVPEAGMGVDVVDFESDGDEDIFVTHLKGESNTLYLNDGAGNFEDITSKMGLGAASLPVTAFGTGFLDYDNDSFLDLFVANGSVTEDEFLVSKKDPYPLHGKNQLFHNERNLTLIDVSNDSGPAFAVSQVSRGSSLGDVDNDGDMDILVANNQGSLLLYLNQEGSSRNWIGFRLLDGDPPRDVAGAAVSVTLPDGRVLTSHVKRFGSYCSARDPRVLLGLGEADRVLSVQTRWLDGTIEQWDAVPLRAYTALVKGKGGHGVDQPRTP